MTAEAGLDPSLLPGWREFVAPVVEEGGRGLVFFPARFSGSEVIEYLDPTGYQVHMSDGREELVLPAGEPVHPPGGRWRIWLQGEWAMTPFPRVIIFPSSPQQGIGFPQALMIRPAGRVRLPEDLAADRRLELSLLFTGVPPWGGPAREFRRQASEEESETGILMPVGETLAFLQGRREERYAAISQPFSVTPEVTIVAPLRRPSSAESWLVVEARRGEEARGGSLEGFSASVDQRGVEKHADVTRVTDCCVYAIWYSLAPGEARVQGGNSAFYLGPRVIEFSAGEIHSATETIYQRPMLDVSMVLPPRVREEPFSLEVWRVPQKEKLVEVRLPRTAGRHRFSEGLIRALLEIRLVTHLGVFRQRVDLSDGGEAFIGLEPELIDISGQVRFGGEPHAATISFRTIAGDRVDVMTGEDGEYEATAIQPLRWVEVRLAETVRGEWLDALLPPIQSSTELNFDISDADVMVRVVDSETGEGIPRAVVAVKNEYVPAELSRATAPSEVESRTETPALRSQDREGKAIAQTYSADEAGLVHLAPPRPGHLEIHASADGYWPLEEPRVIAIENPPRDRKIQVPLETVGNVVQLLLTLPGGAPAVGAEVLRVDSLWEGQALYTGRADETGVVTVPVEPSKGFLLLRHPRASGGVVEWREWRGERQVSWIFAAASEHPLSLRITDPSGDEPVPRARLALFISDWRISGLALRWLANASAIADHSGFWTASGLPRDSVRVLAWRRGLREEAAIGALDNLATEIPFPWPTTSKVKIVN